ncbi:E3 ubiquitin-protein ligase TRIP12 [Phthorimaea operculella]|nr:E3 ubiquitin-protein ligase TRIP12 [Phthorimaea operculella]
MLKRKRAVKRSGGARHARRRDDGPHAAAASPPHHDPQPAHASGVPTARSTTRVGGTSKTSSFLSSLNPSRWGRSPHTHKDSGLLASPHTSANLSVQNKVGGTSNTSSFLSSLNPSRWGRSPHTHKDSGLLASPHTSANLTVQNKVGGTSNTSSFLSSLNPSRWGRSPHTHKDSGLLASPHTSANLSVQNKEKVREWIQWTAARLQREWGALGGGAGALEQLAALAAALPHPQHQRTALEQLRDTLTHHDVSPFEVNHSGVLGALLTFLTGDSELEGEGSCSTTAPCKPSGEQQAACEERHRLFLHVFAGMPLTPDLTEWTEKGGLLSLSRSGSSSALSALVGKVNACVSHLEQFPVRVHDLPARPATSALKFFNTHQLMCDLKRHPTCSNLKQWKGGVVRIDPLALVQAIERYLAQRGYATTRPRDGSAPTPHSDDDNASDDDVEDSLATPPHSQPSDTEHKLEFLIGDTVLPYNMTVYQAVRQFGEQVDADTDTETPLANAGIWVQTHTIYYRAVEAAEPAKTDSAATRKGKGQPTKLSSRRKPDLLWNEGIVPTRESPLVGILRSPLISCGGGEVKDASLPALGEFINTKLAAKANRQLQDPLVIMTGNLPPWLKKIAYAWYKAAIKTELRWFTTTAAMIGREDREDALLKSALQADERVRVVSEHLTECLMLLEEAPNPEDKELVEGDVSQCLELAQDIAQAAADISRRRDGKEKPFRGKVGQGLQVPLPPVTVPVFAGDYADWPAFEDLYSSVVHTRTDITPAYKMAQLMSRLHGEPHELLTHLAVSDSNYEVAWKILTDRYRNKRLIVDRLLDQWLSIPTITRGTDLREKIFHPVSVAVSALERQGLPVAGYGYILVHTVLRRLPSEMVARFEQLHGGKSSDHLPTYEDLKSFLEAESRRVDVQAGEAPRKETSAPRHPERPGAPARGGNSGQPRRYNTALESGCAYCRETGHGVAACQEFAAQRVQRRRGVAQQRRWCFRCLGPHQVRVPFKHQL